MKEVLPQLTQALVPLVFALLSWALLAGANWLRAHAKSEYERGVIARLSDAVATIVRETEQTAMVDIKEASKDGVITDDEYKAIRDGAIARTKAYLGESGVKDLEKVFDRDAIEGVIKSKIEAEVHKLKTETPPVAVDVVKDETGKA